MAYKANVYQILIASPSDVVKERKAIPEVISSWNAVNSADLGVVLLPVMWETHSMPEMGDRPQAIINKQLVKDCDVLIGAFWTRIGTHTGVAESGTVEEIEEFKAANKPIMLYFSSQPVIQDSIDQDQYKKLASFKNKCRKEGLVDQYNSISDLREKLINHLTRIVRDLQKTQPEGYDPSLYDIQPPKNSLEAAKEQFSSFIRKYEAEWTAERDSEPYNIDEGKYILKRLGTDLLEYRSLLDGKTDDKIISSMDNVIKETKILQKHMLYLDGGLSYRKFWESGDSLIQILKELNF